MVSKITIGTHKRKTFCKSVGDTKITQWMITIKLYVKKLKPNLGIIMRYLHTNFEISKTNIFFYSLNLSAAMDPFTKLPLSLLKRGAQLILFTCEKTTFPCEMKKYSFMGVNWKKNWKTETQRQDWYRTGPRATPIGQLA